MFDDGTFKPHVGCTLVLLRKILFGIISNLRRKSISGRMNCANNIRDPNELLAQTFWRIRKRFCRDRRIIFYFQSISNSINQTTAKVILRVKVNVYSIEFCKYKRAKRF